MKLKNLFFLLLLFTIATSCNKDNDKDKYDAATQATLDDEALKTYLQTHYLNAEDGGIWTITFNGAS